MTLKAKNVTLRRKKLGAESAASIFFVGSRVFLPVALFVVEGAGFAAFRAAGVAPIVVGVAVVVAPVVAVVVGAVSVLVRVIVSFVVASLFFRALKWKLVG